MFKMFRKFNSKFEPTESVFQKKCTCHRPKQIYSFV